jgi:hypothetical protein
MEGSVFSKCLVEAATLSRRGLTDTAPALMIMMRSARG